MKLLNKVWFILIHEMEYYESILKVSFKRRVNDIKMLMIY